MRLSSIFLICFFSVWAIAQTENTIDFESLIQDFENDTHIEIGIYNNGDIRHLAFDKTNDQVNNVDSNPNALFEIGSLTKVLVAYMSHSVLTEHSEVNLNSKLKDYALSFPIHKNNDTQILHLINHTAGLPKMPANYLIGMLKDGKNPYLIYTKDRNIPSKENLNK